MRAKGIDGSFDDGADGPLASGSRSPLSDGAGTSDALTFEVSYVNLADKPEWFLAISPHGKVPVLVVDGEVLFESNAIAEYLEEVLTPALHPANPIARARHRAWTDYVPTFSDALGKVTYARDAESLAEACEAARTPLGRLEAAVDADGPFFAGTTLSLVDAGYVPFLMRFLISDALLQTGLLNEFPAVRDWAARLVADARVQDSVPGTFADVYAGVLRRRRTLARERL